LQEAMLMDYDIYGSDINPRMIEYTIANLKWLDSLYPDVGDYRRVEIGDATTHKWHEPEKIDVVAGESFLGQPLTTLPPSDQLSKIMTEANTINHKFLQNISKQLNPGTRICLAVPTWRGKKEFLHLSALDYLDEMGYTRMTFKHVSNEKLIYHREDQVVGRELLVLEKR
jgi:tRNA G10  N-methylase Trm11